MSFVRDLPSYEGLGSALLMTNVPIEPNFKGYPMSEQSILIVDDEADLRNVLDFNLRSAGFSTITAIDGRDALFKARKNRPDLILLDVMLPDMQGTYVCEELKKNSETKHIPIVMVTARGSEGDRIGGFEHGADDYVTKPFSVREVVLRVQAILKRVSAEGQEPFAGNEIRFGKLRMDTLRHRVYYRKEELALTATEFRLLKTFLENRGKIQTREALLASVWGEDISVTPRTVDTHVKRVREKLGPVEHYIETVRGVGYRFLEDP